MSMSLQHSRPCIYYALSQPFVSAHHKKKTNLKKKKFFLKEKEEMVGD